MQEKIENFEKEIATLYEQGKIKAPVHLRNGNIEHLIEIFKDIRTGDYVFSTWASHAHAILKGVPTKLLHHDIMAGKSINLQYPDFNFYSSAIVGGICPIAVGVATECFIARVFVFLGDMSFHTGIAYESIKYAIGHNLAITFVIEDNQISVNTPTQVAWGVDTQFFVRQLQAAAAGSKVNIKYYRYKSDYPHAGTGVFVEF
jgi:pyruvate dehydrogenase E1 component alpha subunit